MAERRRVLARADRVGAGAVGDQVAGAGQQRYRSLGQRGRQFAVEEGGEVGRVVGDVVEEAGPVVVGERADPQPRPVGAGPAAVHVGEDQARGDGDRVDAATRGQVAAAFQAPGVAGPGGERRDPGAAPPGGGGGVAGRAGGEGAAQAVGGGAGAGAGGARHAALRRETRSVSSRSVSSVRAPSPEPRTASARARLAVSSSAMRSSTVPSVMSRWTWTGRVCPIR